MCKSWKNLIKPEDFFFAVKRDIERNSSHLTATLGNGMVSYDVKELNMTHEWNDVSEWYDRNLIKVRMRHLFET